MRVAVVDIGKPGKNLGWAISGSTPVDGTDLDQCIETLAGALEEGPLALGFEAPMYVPLRSNADRLTSARLGECDYGISRPFSASAGSTVLVIGLVVVPYVLARLRGKAPYAVATLNWRSPPLEKRHLLLFEAFVTNQKRATDTRHVEDARLAIAAFQRGMKDPAKLESSVRESDCLNLLGAALLRTGWTADLRMLSATCLVVRA